ALRRRAVPAAGRTLGRDRLDDRLHTRPRRPGWLPAVGGRRFGARSLGESGDLRRIAFPAAARALGRDRVVGGLVARGDPRRRATRGGGCTRLERRVGGRV